MSNSFSRKNKKWVLILIGSLLIVASIVSIIIFLLQGKTMSRYGGSNIENTQSVSCYSDMADYPFYNASDSGRHSIKINAILDNDRLSVVSLVYKIYFDNAKVIEQNNTHLRAAMNKAFANDGLGANAFDAAYSSLADSVQMTLYAERQQLNGNTSSYFLLDGANVNFAKENIIAIYNSKGLNCTVDE